MKTALKILFVLCLSISMTASLANAQKRSLLSTEPEVEETHAADAMKWLENFRNPMHEANYDSLASVGYNQLRGMGNRPAMKSLSSAAWVEVAKSQAGLVSGRPSCIAFDPNGPLYMGVTTGGLWKSANNGLNWTSLSDNWKTLDIGGVAVDPKNPSTVYAGTGISNGGIGGGGDIAGIGVYKSVDGGLNWSLIDSGNVLVTTQMEVNPGNSNYVYRATTSGIQISTDAGASWRTPSTATFGGYVSLVFDPKNPAVLYAGGAGVIKKSIDSGETWQTLSGYPTGQTMSLAMSNSSSDTIYLSTGIGIYDNIQGSSSTLAISTDMGSTWKTQTTSVTYTGTQAYYDNAIAVNPTKPGSVIVGGLDIYTSNNGGNTLSKRTDWLADPASSNYTHADVHMLKYNPYTNELFALTDGGIFHSATNGLSWKQEMNADLGTFLFVGGDMAVDPSSGNPSFFCAGAQDNGLNAFTVGQDQYYRSVRGGDGGLMFISPVDGETCYGTYVNATLYRSQNRGADNFANAGSGGDPNDYYNIIGSALYAEQAPFYMVYDVADQDPNVVAACGYHNLFLTVDGGSGGPSDFPQVTNVGAGTTTSGNASAVHIAKASDQTIYFGTTSGSSGLLYTSEDQAQSWTRSTSPTSFAKGYPTSITTDPNDPTHVYMTISGTGSKHFYYSFDGGATWTAPATNLPALNYHAIEVDQNGTIYIGNDYSVLRSGDTGRTWYPVADGLPMALVTKLHVRGNYLLASTYGRGMFYIDLTHVPPISASSSVSSSTANSGLSISAIYPSIVSESAPRTKVDYSIQSGELATLAVYDALGRQARLVVNEFSTQGQHEVAADLSGLTSGNYYMVLTAGGTSITKPFVIE